MSKGEIFEIKKSYEILKVPTFEFMIVLIIWILYIYDWENYKKESRKTVLQQAFLIAWWEGAS